MNIDTIRNYVISLKNKNLIFKYNCGRGQFDEFEGKILNIYDRIFIVKTNDNKIKSFTLSDVLLKTINFTII